MATRLSSSPRSAGDTPSRLLDAAERLFARDGLRGTSLRAVSASAGANSAAIHYHFGSRDALLEAVVIRRMQAIAEYRRPMLEALAAAPRPCVRATAEALVLPLAQVVAEQGDAGQAYAKVLAQLLEEQPRLVTGVARAHFADALEGLREGMVAARPDLPAKLVRRRYALAFVTLLRVLGNPTLFGGPRAKPGRRWDVFAGELVDWLTGAIGAAVGETSGPPHRRRRPAPRRKNS